MWNTPGVSSMGDVLECDCDRIDGSLHVVSEDLFPHSLFWKEEFNDLAAFPAMPLDVGFEAPPRRLGRRAKRRSSRARAICMKPSVDGLFDVVMIMMNALLPQLYFGD